MQEKSLVYRINQRRFAHYTGHRVDLPIAARAVKQPAVIQTYLNATLYARSMPLVPAVIISVLTSGTRARAVVLLAERAAMNSAREDAGRPRGSTASAILGLSFEE